VLDAALKEWLDNDWVRLAACHPESREVFFYHRTGWETFALPADYVAPTATASEHIIVGKTTTIPVHLLRTHA
jgi:hypothetical protein